ncbi:MAG: TetR/AcrR family transcriptional regulator [Chloroflexi bacterium]|jgi:AcrR family transcriptional regulator|nr:helix-turn-helix domain-containing protein [Anaerolineaceae bacterium]NMB88619.1 TetR/AcrR family transcriptional regulator [Chloroflexota bacterium]
MHKDGKVKIIEAAQRLIARHGVEKTSMRNIAEEAGITTGAIYYYYKSKEELLYDVMDYASAVTAEIMKMRSNPEARPDEVLDEIARKVTQQMKNNRHWNLRFYLALQAAQGDETLRARFASNYAAQTQRTAELFNYVFGTASRPEDLAMAVLMVAALDGINFQQFIGALPVEIDEVARIYNEFFAYAVPQFQKNLEHIHRFDGLQPE